MLEHSPYLERFRARSQDVLLMTDPVDEYLMTGLTEYKGKTFKGADRGSLESEKPEGQEKFQNLLDFLKTKLPEVSDVRLSARLEESAACLVAGEGELSAHMERLLRQMGRGDELDTPRRVLEVNGKHPVVQALLKVWEKEPGDARLETYARLLYDQAVLAEGSKVKDPAALARRINDLLLKDAGV
jgi:molecular chaperone HtpG